MAEDPGAVPRTSRRAVAAVVTAAVAAGVVYSGWYLVLGRFTAVDPDTVSLVAVVMEWLASLTAGVVLLVAAGHRHGAARRSWLAFGVGACLWSMGSLVWVVSLAHGTEPPSPGLADAFYLALPPAMAVGVLTHPAPRRSQVQTRAVIDGLLVASSLLLLLWIGLRGITQTTSPASALVNLAFPLTDVAIITMLVGVVPRIHGRDRTPMLLLAWGMGCVAASDLTLVVLDAYGAYQDAPLVTDAPWTMGFVLMAGAGWLVRTTSAPAMAATAPPAAVRRAAPRSAPIVLAGVALVVALVDLSLRRNDLPWTIPIAVVVVGLLLTRQSWTLTENRRLSDHLSHTVDRLAHQAGHDRLTGLPNRSGLTERLETTAHAAATAGTWSAVLFVDIDHLKSVNDSLGHARGDAVISTIAGRLASQEQAEVTRFGGDEFVMVFSCVDGARTMEDVAREVVERAAAPISSDELTLQPSVSVGVAPVRGGTSPEELLRRADTALYRAKAAGRQRAVVYDPAMDTDTLRRVDLEPELRRALDEDEFEVHYQPVVDLSSGRLIGAEALLRWRHPVEGLLTPDHFLDEADAMGLLGPIGDRTLLEAATRFAEVNARPDQEPVRVAVNLSASELSTADAVDRVQSVLGASGLAPDLMILEIREDVVVDDSTRRTIDRLCELGVGVAIDDFGTGNSSLRQLGSYPASILKVDRTFVDGLGTEDQDTFIVRALLNLAQKLGLQTVAEGVETAEQVRLLQALGCDAAQGWYYDRALPFGRFDRSHLGGRSSRHLRSVT